MIRQLIRFVVFVGITGGLTVWIGLQIAQYEGGDHDAYQAVFDDVTGLFPGDDVKLTGVQVGKVTSISFDEGRARVRFEIDADIELPCDTEVAVRWRNLIGQRFLYLYEGEGDDVLGVDCDDEVDVTTAVTDITDLVNTLGPLFSAVDPEELNAILETLVQALDGNGDNVDGLVAGLDSVLATLAERDGTVQQLLSDYATITGELASRDQQIQTMVDNLVLLSQTFAENTDLVDRAIVELGAFAGDLDAVLTGNEAHLASILGNLGLITDTAAGRLDELEAALNNLPLAVQDLFDVVNDGEFLNINVPCVSLTPPPCTGIGGTLPISAPAGTGAATAGGGTPLDALLELLLGPLQGAGG